MKNEEPRKNDQRTSDVHHFTQNSNNTRHSISNENDIKISSLTGKLTTEEIEKLAKMGIKTISQFTQLTVLQVIELDLSKALISELQLKVVQVNIFHIQFSHSIFAVKKSND